MTTVEMKAAIKVAITVDNITHITHITCHHQVCPLLFFISIVSVASFERNHDI